MRWRHPSRTALRRWLAGNDDARTEQHVATCDRCATRLEAIAADLGAADRGAGGAGAGGAGPAAPMGAAGGVGPDDRSPALRAALEALLVIPPELPSRLTAQVHERQQQIRWQDVVVDAVGGGLDTLRLLMGDTEESGDG